MLNEACRKGRRMVLNNFRPWVDGMLALKSRVWGQVDSRVGVEATLSLHFSFLHYFDTVTFSSGVCFGL
jgi:hypothetical protein